MSGDIFKVFLPPVFMCIYYVSGYNLFKISLLFLGNSPEGQEQCSAKVLFMEIQQSNGITKETTFSLPNIAA
jgi:hypothetical protein